MTRLLVTTALEETWDKNRDMLFLGEWCRVYERHEMWSKIDMNVLSNHWNDRGKLKKDHDDLKELYERTLTALTDKLNQIHQIQKSTRYWRIIIGPWLISYLPCLFDRWEALRIAFSKHETFETFEENMANQNIPYDYNEYMEIIRADGWNYLTFLRIIRFQYDRKVKILTKGSEIQDKKPRGRFNRPQKQSYLYRAAIVVDYLLSSIFKSKTNIVFYRSYFRLSKLIRINLLLRQMPSFFYSYFDRVQPGNVDLKQRTDEIFISAKTDFERFVSLSLLKDMPMAYLECYKDISLNVNQLGLRPQAIVTATGHFVDEHFKVWCAEKVENGIKLIVTDHGGALPPLFDLLNHDDDIADHRITWFKPIHHKQIQLSPSKLIGFNIKSSRKYCSLIGLEQPRYTDRACAYPIAEQTLNCLEDALTFCRRLNVDVFTQLKVKASPNRGWNTKKRYEDRLGKDKIYTSESYYGVLKKSKLIVCTYADTTFSEAMVSGIPTILLIKTEFYEKMPQAHDLIQLLKEVNIMFEDPIKAADHVNSIWDMATDWWFEPRVIRVRDIFLQTSCKLGRSVSNDLKDWATLLKKLCDADLPTTSKLEKA